MSDLTSARTWLQQNGYIAFPWFGGSWKVRDSFGDSKILKTDARLIRFAKEKGWNPKGAADE